MDGTKTTLVTSMPSLEDIQEQIFSQPFDPAEVPAGEQVAANPYVNGDAELEESVEIESPEVKADSNIAEPDKEVKAEKQPDNDWMREMLKANQEQIKLLTETLNELKGNKKSEVKDAPAEVVDLDDPYLALVYRNLGDDLPEHLSSEARDIYRKRDAWKRVLSKGDVEGSHQKAKDNLEKCDRALKRIKFEADQFRPVVNERVWNTSTKLEAVTWLLENRDHPEFKDDLTHLSDEQLMAIALSVQGKSQQEWANNLQEKVLKSKPAAEASKAEVKKQVKQPAPNPPKKPENGKPAILLDHYPTEDELMTQVLGAARGQ